jgi:hypothetical protein
LGAREEMTLGELRKMNCVGDDNVHLRETTNRNAAETLCHIVAGDGENRIKNGDVRKADEDGVGGTDHQHGWRIRAKFVYVKYYYYSNYLFKFTLF